MKKSIFTFILIAAMIIPTFIVSAKTFPDVSSSSGYVNEVKALTDNGVIIGDDYGNFRPNDNISRAEFATILCRVLGPSVLKEAESGINNNDNTFVDVPSTFWAAGYINTAVKYDAINGMGPAAGGGVYFAPLDPVTNEQVIKTLVAAWGYKDEAESLGGYPNGYMEVASRFGVTDDVLFNYGNASKRWVTSMFVCGVLDKLPISDAIKATIAPPAINISSEPSSPLPENTEYVSDPISVLKRVTLQSLKYERKVFEQQVPSNQVPFTAQGNNITNNSGRNYTLMIPQDKNTLFKGNIAHGASVSIGNLPNGTWQAQFTTTDGAIKDTFFINITKSDSGVNFGGVINRYTYINTKPKITEIDEDVTITNETTDSKLPFTMKYASGKLSIDYGISALPNNEYIAYSINKGVEDVYTVHGPKDMKILTFDTPQGEYNALIELNNDYGDSKSFRGTLTVTEDDFILKGTFTTLTVDGLEFSYF